MLFFRKAVSGWNRQVTTGQPLSTIRILEIPFLLAIRMLQEEELRHRRTNSRITPKIGISVVFVLSFVLNGPGYVSG